MSEVEAVLQEDHEREDPASCRELELPRYREQTTLTDSFSAALERCEGGPVDRAEWTRSISVADVDIAPDRLGATANVDFAGGIMDGQTLTIGLKKVKAHWKLSEVVGFSRFDRAKLIATFAGMFLRAGESPEAASCILEFFRTAPAKRIEAYLFGRPAVAIRGLVDRCFGGPFGRQSS